MRASCPCAARLDPVVRGSEPLRRLSRPPSPTGSPCCVLGQCPKQLYRISAAVCYLSRIPARSLRTASEVRLQMFTPTRTSQSRNMRMSVPTHQVHPRTPPYRSLARHTTTDRACVTYASQTTFSL